MGGCSINGTEISGSTSTVLVQSLMCYVSVAQLSTLAAH
jgi:hypothetical protein